LVDTETGDNIPRGGLYVGQQWWFSARAWGGWQDHRVGPRRRLPV